MEEDLCGRFMEDRLSQLGIVIPEGKTITCQRVLVYYWCSPWKEESNLECRCQRLVAIDAHPNGDHSGRGSVAD